MKTPPRVSALVEEFLDALDRLIDDNVRRSLEQLYQAVQSPQQPPASSIQHSATAHPARRARRRPAKRRPRRHPTVPVTPSPPLDAPAAPPALAPEPPAPEPEEAPVRPEVPAADERPVEYMEPDHGPEKPLVKDPEPEPPPAAEEPSPEAEEPTPAAEEPTPAAEEPTPAAEEQPPAAEAASDDEEDLTDWSFLLDGAVEEEPAPEPAAVAVLPPVEMRAPAKPEIADDDDELFENELSPTIAAARKKVTLDSAGRVRAKTISTPHLTRDERRASGLVVYPDVDRPVVRHDCESMPRPCPFVSCAYHLYLDVNPETGTIKFNFPDKEPWELTESCTLDVADRGGITLEELGRMLNLTRERIRQLEVRALEKLKKDAKGDDDGVVEADTIRYLSLQGMSPAAEAEEAA